MAVLGTNYLTLADWARRQDPDGKLAVVVDLLSQSNEMLQDMPFMEGNLTDGYKTTVRTGLPSGTWRQLYQGVQPTKSTTAQIVERTANLEAFSEPDAQLVELNGNQAQFRLDEAAAFMEGLSQQVASAMVYSSVLTAPAQFTGLAPRYNTVNPANAAIAANVIDAGGTGTDNTSMWLIGWGPNTVSGIFPKGKITGLQHQDLGKYLKQNSDGSRMMVYGDHYQWELGLCVRDWRYAVRICNIDVSDLTGASAANLVNLLIRAASKVPTGPSSLTAVQSADKPSGVVGPANFRIYCNRTVRTALETQIVNKPGANINSTIFLTPSEYGGMPVLTFRGIPIRTMDSILNAEARVV